MATSVADKLLLEARVLALERSLGLVPTANDQGNQNSTATTTTTKTGTSKKNDTMASMSTRLERLEGQYKKMAPTSLHNMWNETNTLLQDLHPGTNLTYQQPIASRHNYPILYRKQHILAATQSLKNDMAQLSDILNLLLIGNADVNAAVTEETVTEAPILTAGGTITADQQQRLDSLRVGTVQAQQKTEELAERLDSLVGTYKTVLTALSDRAVGLAATKGKSME